MSTIKISQLGNLTTVQGNVIIPVVGNIAGTLTTVQSNVAQLQTYILGTVVTDLANLTASTTANAAVQSGAIADVSAAWQANAETQLSQITAANAAIVTANTALKGYVDAQDTIISNSVIAANAAIVTANTALKGYVDAQDTIISNSVTGANAAIVTANTALKGYVDAQDTIISNSVTGANAAIVTANTNMKGYVDAANTIQSNEITVVSNSVTGANAAIVTANTNMKGYVDGQLTSLIGGAPSALDTLNEIAAALGNDANLSVTLTNTITTANTNMKGYVDANNATQLTSIENITNGSIGFGNIIPSVDGLYSLGNMSYQWTSLYTNTISVSTINLPLNGTLTSVLFEGTDYSVLNGSNIGGAAITASNNYVAVTQTQANVLIYNANTAVTHTWQFTKDGDINLPNGSVLETNEDTPGMPSVSLSSGINGGVSIAAISSNITAINGVFNQVTVNEYNAAIIIGDQIDGNVSYSWLFTTVANVGVISFPDSTNQQTAYTATLANVTPASATDTGIKGDIVYDASYIYICVETDQWIRAARDAW